MKNKTLKEKCKEIALFSSSYGLPHMIRSDRSFNKIFWLCFTLLSSSAAAYYVYSNITEYYSFNRVSFVRHEYEQLAQFPTVTFCSHQKKYFDDKNLSQIISNVTFNYDNIPNNKLEDNFERFQSVYYGRCFRFNSGKDYLGRKQPIKNVSGASQVKLFL